MSDPDTDWEPTTPQTLMTLLRPIPAHWYIVGGWALDLWHRHQTRDHEDLEFCVLRPDIGLFRAALSGFDWHTAQSGTVTPLRTTDPAPKDTQQFWAQRRSTGRFAFDMMVEPGSAENWRYKRDATVTAPRRDVIRATSKGIPYLAPAAVLLFKAKHLRDKDTADFDAALAKLSPSDRDWLAQALARLHPDHVWLSRL